MIPFIIIIGMLTLLFAAVYDLKYREVPDTISYGLIVIVAGTSLIQAIITKQFQPFLWTAGTGVIFYLLGLGLYATGHWGGGDSKLLIGSSMLLSSFLPLVYLIMIFIVGAIYGLCYALILFFINHKQSFPAFYTYTKKGSQLFSITFIIAIIFFITGFLINFPYSLLFYMLSIIFLITPLLWSLTKIVEEHILKEWMTIKEVTEGEWLAEPVKIKNKIILQPPRLGLDDKDIALLKRHKIKKVYIKKGIPFIPSFFFGFIITYFFGYHILSLFPL